MVGMSVSKPAEVTLTAIESHPLDADQPEDRSMSVLSDPALRVEPMIGIKWAQALEQYRACDATDPAAMRRAWVHRANEAEVLALYRSARTASPTLPVPWWLRALADGLIPTRAEAFTVEDRVTKLLQTRPGWVFVPWGADGDTGYWEYMPSERTLTGPGMPTTLQHTGRHPGLIDVIRVHGGDVRPAPLAIAGVADLRASLARIESLRPLSG